MSQLLEHLHALDTYLPQVQPTKWVFGKDDILKRAKKEALSCLNVMIDHPHSSSDQKSRFKEQADWLSDKIVPRATIIATLRAVHSNASKLVGISHSNTIESDLST